MAKGLTILATVLTIDNVVTTDVDVAVPQLTQSELVLRSAVTDLKTGVSTTVYVLPTGDPNYPMTATVRTEKSPSANASAIRRSSITLATWARVTVDDVVVEIKPISVVIAFNLPNTAVEAGDISDLIGNAYGLTFGTLNTKVPSTDHISSLMFGITELFG